MKILIPTADYPPIEGGISTVTLNVSRELAKLGHDVTLLAPYFPDMETHDRSEPYRVGRYRGYGLGWLRLLPLAALSARHIRNADLILGMNIAYGGVIGALARTAAGKPYVTFGYAYEFLKFPAGSPPALLLRAAYRRSRLVVAISRFTQDALVDFGVPPKLIEVVHPGATPARAVSLARIEAMKQRLSLNGHRVVFAAGRMMPRKGHATLVQAMPRILTQHPNTILVCAGRGPACSEVERAVAELNLADHVRLPGVLSDDDLATLYAMCDVFALPAGHGTRGHVEGFGLVFAEAGAYGKPVIGGDSGGVRDAIIDNETGLLVEPGNPEASAAAIARLLADADLARRLGENGRERVARELNWATFTRRLVDAVERRA